MPKHRTVGPRPARHHAFYNGGSGYCVTCGLPKRNARHNLEPVEVEDRTEPRTPAPDRMVTR